MRTIKAIILGVACLTAGAANAQWVVHDPGNLAQGIINTAKEMVETSATAQHTLDGFRETAKIFEQGRKYYDALKAVHDVVKGGVKVKKSIGLVADISEIYVRNYQKMLGDPNYTPDELETISFGYAKLLSESADILQDLKNVVNVTGMSLSDAERLAIIDQSYKRLLEYRNLVQYYTDKNISVSYLRAKKKKDADRVVALYGDAEDRYWLDRQYTIMFTYINIIQDYVVSDRLHEPARDIAGIVSGHDAALREADGGSQGNCRAGCAVLRSRQGVAGARPCRTH